MVVETANILIHKIHSRNLKTAIDLASQKLSTLIDEVLGANYEAVDCSE